MAEENNNSKPIIEDVDEDYIEETESLEPTDGAEIVEKKKRNPFYKFIFGLFLIIVFLGLIGALVLIKSMGSDKSDELVVKPDTRQTSNYPDEEQKLNNIDQVRETADSLNEISPSPSPINAEKITIAEGQTVDTEQPTGVPIYDTSDITVDGQTARETKTLPKRSSSRQPKNNTNNNVQPSESSPKEDIKKSSSAKLNNSDNTISNSRVAYSGSGRNKQSSLSFYSNPSSTKKFNGIRSSKVALTEASKPEFGTLIPVRVLGVVHSLQTGNLVRLQTLRSMQGKNWFIPANTIFIGRVAGSADKRLFLKTSGFIDSKSNSLIELSGDLMGRDGGLGFKGKKKKLKNRWKKIFGSVIDKATQLGSAYLLGRRGGGGGGVLYNSGAFDQRTITDLMNNDSQSFVIVEAGSIGYILINDLPETKQVAENRLLDNTQINFGDAGQTGQISDVEIIRLLTEGSKEDLRRALPRMSPEWQQMARIALEQ